jgi:hypothetical protein
VYTLLSSGNSPVGSIAAASLTFLVFLAIGSPVVYAGWEQRRQYHELSAVHTSLDDATPGEAVVVSGTVSSRSQTVDSPYRSQSCALALWDTARLSRGQGTQWILEASGVTAGELLVTVDTEHVPITGFPRQRRVATTSQKLRSTLGLDGNSELAFVDTELSRSGFERQFTPTEALTDGYRAHNRDIGFDRPTRDSDDTVGRLLTGLLTPHNTVRYRELIFQSGDEITVVGKKTDDGISFTEAGATQPIISSEQLPSRLGRYRRGYILRLYGLPMCLSLFSALIGYTLFI